jgi:hypothetical protein
MPLNLLFIAAIILIITAATLYYIFIIKAIEYEQKEEKKHTTTTVQRVKATLYIEVFDNGDIDTVSIKGYGSKKILRESIIKVMAKSDSYFELFMECAAIHMLDEKNKKVI